MLLGKVGEAVTATDGREMLGRVFSFTRHRMVNRMLSC
jgi:hypothetical protein